MTGYIQIIWRFDDFDLPRVLFVEDNIGEDDLVEIVESKSANKVLEISQFTPPKYLLRLYVGLLQDSIGNHPVLIISLSSDFLELFEDVLKVELLYCFGRYQDNVLIWDTIRMHAQQILLREEGTRLYFQEREEQNDLTILQLIHDIFQIFHQQISGEEQWKAEFKALTTTCDN